MKRKIILASGKIMLALSLVSYAAVQVDAQEYQGTPVSVSTEKVRYQGKVCYAHKVLERQTLFSICKAYGVTAGDIYGVNPKLKETGLRKDSIILVPEISSSTAPASAEMTEAPQTAETVQNDDTPAEKKQTVHIRKWYEDLETIAAKYGVSVQALMKANNLKGRKLANRQELVIPDPSDVYEEDVAEVVATEAEPAEPDDVQPDIQQDTVYIPDCAEQTDSAAAYDFPFAFYPKEKVEATLLLPLRADGKTGSRNNLDFYSGVLLAVNDMAEEGIAIGLNVYDIASGETVTAKELEGSDIVIGPVSASDIDRYLDILPEGAVLVSPLDQRAERLAAGCSSMVQAPTPHETQYRDLAEWLTDELAPADKVVFITESGCSSDVETQMKAALDASAISYKPFSYSILEGRDVTAPLTVLMTDTGTNRVVIGSDNEAFVNDVVRNLNLLIHTKLDVVLYGTSRIRGFETIEAENLHNVNMRVSLGYYIDYEEEDVKSFLLKYRALFNTEPTQFAFQGYDTARYFITLVHRYGSRWQEMLNASGKAMLQSTFAYGNDSDGGYVNQGVRRIVYNPGWTVDRIK